MSRTISDACDTMLAAGLAPWVVGRLGDSFGSDPGEDFFWADRMDDPPDPPWPRLDGTPTAGLIDDRGRHGCWYLPDYRLIAADLKPEDELSDDVGFRFEARQTGEVLAGARPLNRAVLSFTFSHMMSKEILESFSDRGNLSEVPNVEVEAWLAIPVAAQDGSSEMRKARTVARNAASGNYFVEFELTGDDVGLAYVHLTQSGSAELHVTTTYTGYQKVLIPGSAMELHSDGVHWFGDRFIPIGDGDRVSSADVTIDPDRDTIEYLPVRTSFNRTLPLEMVFNTDKFRSRFTITSKDVSRPIIDVSDLNEFVTPRSEFRELTSLGEVSERYSSLQRLYYGQVSGTVIAIPASYGIVRSSSGLAARCDAIVDPTGINGCRFDFTFTIAPIIDPIDMARLESDLRSTPEAATRSLEVRLPSGLDSRRTSSLSGFASAISTFTTGPEPHTVQVSVEISDTGTTPATTNVNLFLNQLTAADAAALFGDLFVRIDDAFPQPVTAHAVLNLRRTAGSDELTAVVTSDPTARAAAINHGPFDLTMSAFVVLGAAEPRITILPNQILPPGQSAILTTDVADARSVEVSRTLALPTPLPKQRLLELVNFDTQVVQELQHPLTVNATAVNFAADGISSIEVHFSLVALPDIPIPTLTLKPAHAVDFVHVSVPVTAAVADLECRVTLTVTKSGEAASITVTHDYVADPILVVTGNTLAEPG